MRALACFAALLALLAPASALGARPIQEFPIEEAGQTEPDHAALVKEYEAALAAWNERIAQGTPDEQRALRERHPAADFWPRFTAAAEAGEGRALLWMATHLREKGASTREMLPEKRRLYAALFDQHASSVWFGAVLDALPEDARHLEPGRLPEAYRLTIEKNPFPEVRAQAMYQLGKLLLASEDPEQQAEGKRWLQRLSEEHGETRFGNVALMEISMPVLGQLAPDFSARTIDGERFRLSDFRGKVVLLDFYGFWCGYCMKALPHLRELVARHADEPFALVGIDANDSEEAYRRGLASHKITWTSAYQGPAEEISRLYRVRTYPSYFLIDADGTLVRAGSSSTDFDAPIRELLAKLREREQHGPARAPHADRPRDHE